MSDFVQGLLFGIVVEAIVAVLMIECIVQNFKRGEK